MNNQPFIYHTVLRVADNQDENATDFTFTDVHPSFEELLKPVAGKVHGQLCSKVLSRIGDSGADVVSTLLKAYNDGSTEITEIYCSGLDLYFRIQATGHSDGSITALFVDSSAQNYLERQLIERRKEFKAVLLLSELNDIERPTREIISNIVEKLPGSWQYPEYTYCRIKLDGDEMASDNYQLTKCILRESIRKDQEKIGFIEVGYIKSFPDIDIGPFLREEKELLKIVAGGLSEIIKNKSIYSKLHASRSLLDSASSLANLGAWSVDLATNKSTWSDQVAKIHELPPGSAPGPAKGMSYYEPEYRDRIADAFQRCAVEGVPYNEVMAIRTEKGNRRWVKATGEPVRDEHGQIVKVQGAFQDITETVETGRTLKENEKRFRQIFQNHSAVKLIIDPGDRGKIKLANQAAAKFYGWSVEKLENMLISDINVLGPDKVQKEMKNVMANKSSHYEFRHKKADGSICDVEVFTSKVNINGKEYLHSIIHDVTEKKEARQALIESEKMLGAMINASPVAIYRLSLEGVVESWNRAAADMFGWSEEEVIGKMLPTVPEHKKEEFEGLCGRVGINDSFTGVEIKRQKKDGSDIHISLSTASITDQSGDVVGIIAIASDITERKKGDDRILLQSTALNSVANAIIITDTNGKIEWVNDAWTALTGYDEEEVLGGNPRILKSGKQDESYYQELWSTILRGDVWEGELINKRKDGSCYYELQTITPLVGANGEVKHLIGIKQDITQRKQTEKNLRELLEEKEVLLSEVHHRVKNNMAILSAIMYLELIQTNNRDVSVNIQKNINRIETIGSIHELVYKSDKLAKINVGEILSRIAKCDGQDDASECIIQINIDAYSVFINVNQALPASLIINEAITGICKAKKKKKRTISQTIKVSEIQNSIEMIIDVTGFESSQSLSEMLEPVQKQLINILTEQLEGEITFNENKIILRFERNDKAMGAGNHFL